MEVSESCSYTAYVSRSGLVTLSKSCKLTNMYVNKKKQNVVWQIYLGINSGPPAEAG